jgi:hypothetical protein
LLQNTAIILQKIATEPPTGFPACAAIRILTADITTAAEDMIHPMIASLGLFVILITPTPAHSQKH